MSKGKSSDKGNVLFSNLLGTKTEKGVTKQRGKSKDRYHQDPPDIPGGYDSEEETMNWHANQDQTSKEKTSGAKSKFQGLFKSSSDKPSAQRNNDYSAEHEAMSNRSHTKGGGRETPKKSKFQSLFGSSNDGKSTKKKPQDRYHQKNPQGNGLFSNLFGTKPEKGVTKQRSKSKDRYHQDPPDIPGGYDSEEETMNWHANQDQTSKEKTSGAKSKRQGLFKPSSDKPSAQRNNDYLAEHEARPNKSRTKGGGRETPKKSTFQSLFGSSNDGKSTKKKSQDRYHQKNPYENESKGGSGGGGGGGGWWSGGGGGGGGGSSGQAKAGKSKGRSAGRQSKGGGGGGFSIPSF